MRGHALLRGSSQPRDQTQVPTLQADSSPMEPMSQGFMYVSINYVCVYVHIRASQVAQWSRIWLPVQQMQSGGTGSIPGSGLCVCVCVCVYSIYVCLVYTHKTNSLLALTSTVVLTSREGKLREENEEFSRLNKAI